MEIISEYIILVSTDFLKLQKASLVSALKKLYVSLSLSHTLGLWIQRVIFNKCTTDGPKIFFSLCPGFDRLVVPCVYEEEEEEEEMKEANIMMHFIGSFPTSIRIICSTFEQLGYRIMNQAIF